MRLIALLVLAVACQGFLFAQKLQDPGLPKNSRPDPARVVVHKRHSDMITAVKRDLPSTNDVAKVEQNGIKSAGLSARKASQKSVKSVQLPANESSAHQRSAEQSSKIKFSYQPPQTGTKPARASQGAHATAGVQKVQQH